MKLPKQARPVIRNAVYSGQTIVSITPSGLIDTCCLPGIVGTYCPGGCAGLRCPGGCKVI